MTSDRCSTAHSHVQPGYSTVSNKDIVDVDIADAINGYFNAYSLNEAMQFITRADVSYPDPRYRLISPEERRKDILTALFSSIVSSQMEKHDLALLLDVLSRADMIVGRANASRQWHLLKYVNSLIATGLYEKSRQTGYQIPPVSNAVACDGTDICPIAVNKEDLGCPCYGSSYVKKLCRNICPALFYQGYGR